MSAGKRNLQPMLGATVSDYVRQDHLFRRLLEIVPFEELCRPLEARYSTRGRRGYPVATMFKALLVQWMENRSDREMEAYLDENLAGKLFCGLELGDDIPDHSSLCVMRARLGTNGLALLFNRVREYMVAAGLVREAFTFVDSTAITAKTNMWREKDRLAAEGEALSNQTVAKVAADPDARLGRKGGTGWYGYKLHVGADMAHGLIVRVAATPANVEDEKAARHVLPRQGMVLADKAYCVGSAAREIRRRGLHSGAIRRRQMRGKDADKDRWLTRLRMPYEGMFARFAKRARYRGLVKCQFQAFMQALSHNMKRLVAIGAPPLGRGPSCA